MKENLVLKNKLKLARVEKKLSQEELAKTSPQKVEVKAP